MEFSLKYYNNKNSFLNYSSALPFAIMVKSNKQTRPGNFFATNMVNINWFVNKNQIMRIFFLFVMTFRHIYFFIFHVFVGRLFQTGEYECGGKMDYHVHRYSPRTDNRNIGHFKLNKKEYKLKPHHPKQMPRQALDQGLNRTSYTS